ncbi:MAG: Ig-like domain-containing protein [Bacteroidetes bacterium]|nr:Ig-like domain-containing protein [Bacteroidota bacterium]
MKKDDTSQLKPTDFRLDKNSFLPLLFLIVLLILISIKSWGQLDPNNSNENFVYPAGNLVGQGNWTLQGSDNTNPIQVVSPGLYYPGYASSGIGLCASLGQNATGQDLFKNFTLTSTISSGSVYISALVKVTAASRAGDYFLSFKETTGASLTVFKGRLYAKDTASTGNLVFGVTKSTSSSTAPVSWTPTYYSFNTTYLVVMKYTFVAGAANDVVDLYVFDATGAFPLTEPSPNATATDAGSDGTGQRCVQLRQGALNSPVTLVDGIRIGQSWSAAVTQDVTPPVATFVPASGSVNVLLSIVPTITFNEPVKKTDGTDITNSDLTTLVSLKLNNSTGTAVPFTATIDATKTIVTVTPSGALLNNQLYYLAIAPVEDGAGNVTGTQSSTFTTIPAALSNDATLSDLKVNGTTIAGFSPTIYTYHDTVFYGLPAVPAVTATPNFPLATVGVTPAAAIPGTTSVLVTAQDGITQHTYTVSFVYHTPSTNSKLSYIKWLPNGLDPIKQNIRVKDFSTTIFDYNIEVPVETNSLVVDAEPDFVIPASGCPPATYVVTQPVNLTGTIAERTATVVCTAQDGITTSTYHVTFSKSPSSTVYLYKEGFNTMPPAGWSNTSQVGSSATNGMGFYGSVVTYATPKFKWFSPTDGGTLTTSAANGAGTFQFFVKVLDKNPASNLHLFVEKSYNNADWTLVSQDPMPLYATITQWHQVVLPINDNSPQVYLRIRASATTGDNSTGLFYIDDVSLTEGPPAVKALNLKIYLEGLYNSGTGNMNQAMDVGFVPKFASPVADQLTVELHDAVAPYDITLFNSVPMVFNGVNLDVSGNVSIPSIPGALNGSYYVVLKHRNSMETWNSAPVSFAGSGPVSYDFSTSNTQAFGDNLKPMGSVYAVYGGDTNQDGVVDGSDMANVDNASTGLLVGYFAEDVNGDGVVDGSDMALIDNNSTAVIHVFRPN